ncbi:MAG: hypothetical protein WBR26_11405 [Candidatus Acidiferrum sp.]
MFLSRPSLLHITPPPHIIALTIPRTITARDTTITVHRTPRSECFKT